MEKMEVIFNSDFPWFGIIVYLSILRVLNLGQTTTLMLYAAWSLCVVGQLYKFVQYWNKFSEFYQGEPTEFQAHRHHHKKVYSQKILESREVLASNSIKSSHIRYLQFIQQIMIRNLWVNAMCDISSSNISHSSSPFWGYHLLIYIFSVCRNATKIFAWYSSKITIFGVQKKVKY